MSTLSGPLVSLLVSIAHLLVAEFLSFGVVIANILFVVASIWCAPRHLTPRP